LIELKDLFIIDCVIFSICLLEAELTVLTAMFLYVALLTIDSHVAMVLSYMYVATGRGVNYPRCISGFYAM